MHPEVRQLGDFGVVRRDGHRLGAAVAHLGEKVRVGGACLRHVAAPRDDVRRVVPVGRFRHVGLLTPHLRTCRRQVAIPVVETHADAADQRQVARARGIADHAHRWNRREADHAIGTPGLGRIDVGRGDDLVDFVPGRTHEAAEAADLLVIATLGLVLHDRRPRLDRAVLLARRAPVLQQPSAHHRMLDAVGAIQVPAVRRAARATPWLMVGHVRARARVVGLLRLPGHDAALDVDLP